MSNPADVSEKNEPRDEENLLAQIQEFLGGIQIGGAIHHQEITLFPTFGEGQDQRTYLLLKEALEMGDAVITEVSSDGEVPALKVINHSDLPLFIPEGEILVGGKQNRVVNITIIIQPGSAAVIPVSCVERGRWNRSTQSFQSGFHAPPSMRAMKTASVQSNRARGRNSVSDQCGVWDQVECCMESLNASSETDSLTDAFREIRDKVKDYSDHLVLPEKASGFIVGIGGRVAGMDVFDSSHTAQSLWPKISEGYLMQSVMERRGVEGTPLMEVTDFLSEVSHNLKVSRREGDGVTELEVRCPSVVGFAVLHNGHLCHLSAFPRQGQ